MSAIAEAATILSRGGLVAFPTETVYGLGAAAADPDAVRRVFAAKGRSPRRPLSVLVAPEADMSAWGTWSDRAARLAVLWPGPLTLVLPRTARAHDVLTGGRPTVGLRVPDHPVALDLLRAFGDGVAAPSANRSGSPSPTTAQHVRDDLGDAVDLILDGGACPLGIESTVLSLVGPARVLRQGAIGRARLAEILREPVLPPATEATWHTRTPLHLVSADAVPTGRVGVWSRTEPAGVAAWRPLPDEPDRAAGTLYATLRELDALELDALYVVRPAGEAWRELVGRLERAADTSSG